MTLPAVAAPPTVWTAPSLVRIGPDEAAGTATDIQLYAAKGETESFQILVKAPTGGLTNVNVVAPNLGGPQCTLYREYYAYIARSSADWSGNLNHPLGAGWYPDGLIPFVNPSTGADLTGTLDAVPFSLAAGKNQPIWVDVYVPRTTAAGNYAGTFQITSNQGTATITLHFTVWNFTLPVKPALKSMFRYSSSTYSRVSQPAKEIIRHRLMPQFVPTAEERTLIDALGLNTTDVPFYADTSGTYIEPAPSAATFQTEAAKHQPDLPLYCYMADEIGWNTAYYSTIKTWARNMHTAGIDNLITMMPDPLLYDDGSGTGRSAVDLWVVLPKQYDQVPDRMQYVISKGDEGWSYNCLAQDDYSPKWLLDMAPINYRIQPGFINQSLNLTGLLYWAVDDWGSDPWNNPMPWSPYPAEGLLVYPGANVGLSGQTIGAIRLKWLRDGVDDYDYVALLKQAGLKDWALGITRTIGPNWRNWSRDPVALEAARRQLGEKLNSLAGGTPTDTVTASASVNPSTVTSGGLAYLTGSAADSAGHTIASWSWSDGGAGGSFSSATAQSPTYTAPANTGTTNRIVTLTVTARCNDATPASGSASATLTVTPAGSTTHTLTVTASVSPTTVASAGTATLTATAADSLGLPVASWSWSDGGAGGTFSSAAVQNPTYRSPSNTGTTNKTVTFTVRATSSGTSPITASASRSLTVTPATTSGHYLTVTATATPSTVASGGSTTLNATVTDSQPHSGFAYQWSDGGAGGTFSLTTVRNPTYRAPANTGTTNRVITLTITATCKWVAPWVSASAATTLTVQPSAAPAHTLTVTASASPSTVVSAGTASLGATALDSSGHTIVSWSWSDGGAGGTFSSTTIQNPTYRAPANTGATNRAITLTARATCSGATPITASATTTLTVQPATTSGHYLTVTATATPSTVASGGSTALLATVVDNQPHSGFAYAWSDGGAGGTFSSTTVRNPTYRAPANATGVSKTVTLTVTATCKWVAPWVSATTSVPLVVQSQ